MYIQSVVYHYHHQTELFLFSNQTALFHYALKHNFHYYMAD